MPRPGFRAVWLGHEYDGGRGRTDSSKSGGVMAGSTREQDVRSGDSGQCGFDVVTGAFSYSGAAITARLLAGGRQVRTLTGHPGRAPAGTAVQVRPLDFT